MLKSIGYKITVASQNILFLILLFLITIHSNVLGQIYDPVDWNYEAEYIGEGTFQLNFDASIQDGWHLYATLLSTDKGPIPTSVTLGYSFDFKILEKLNGGKFKMEYDPDFTMDLNFYDHNANFDQLISLF